MSAVAVPPAPLESTRKLAGDIKAQTTGLDNEDRQAEGAQLRHYARSKKLRDEDRAKLNGMTIALTYMLGEPGDMAAARAFIAAPGEKETQAETGARTLRAAVEVMRRYRGGLATVIAVLEETAAALEEA